ncbi:MAG: glycosyltransferase [Anaerolineales bacterium]|nr:glycosyltransferase [Anaerolineales bacterium]
MLQASIIIPTYNRFEFLRETLHTIANQHLSPNQYEVIVVDDGSTDNTSEIKNESFPFDLVYVYQRNQGDAIARNLGAEHSQATYLIFLDDDILIEPHYVEAMLKAHNNSHQKIVAGQMYLQVRPKTVFSWLYERESLSKVSSEVNFAEVSSNNMSVHRESHFDIGQMEGLGFSGSNIWCDVDFNYRAYLKGYKFVKAPNAVCYHRDYTMVTLQKASKRLEKAAYQAVKLFRKYPDLHSQLPMFRDKQTINWKQDSARLIIKKELRRFASSNSTLWGMQEMAAILEQNLPLDIFLKPLYRWILGGHIFRGYHQGLQELEKTSNYV